MKKFNTLVCLSILAMTVSAHAQTLVDQYLFNQTLNASTGTSNGYAGTGTGATAPGYVATGPTNGYQTSLVFGATYPTGTSTFNIYPITLPSIGAISLWTDETAYNTGGAQAYLVGGAALDLVDSGGGATSLNAILGGTSVTLAGLSNGWEDLTVTYNNSTMQASVYENGVAQVVFEAVNGVTTNEGTVFTYGTAIGATGLTFGSYSAGTGFGQYDFQGDINDLQIYSGTVTSAEAAQLYANPESTVPEPSTYSLALGGIALFFLVRRFRRSVLI